MKDFAKRFYKSTQWQRCRKLAWQRDHGLCVDCLKIGMITPAEEVHHIIPLSPENIDDPEVSLNLTNLVSLCRECHKARHEGHDQRRYRVDSKGEIFIIPD